MRYEEIAEELERIANQLTELAGKIKKAEEAVPEIAIKDDKKMTNKIALTVSETAEALSVSKSAVYQLVHRDDFPSFKIGHRVLIHRDKLLAWVDDHCGETI